jgi:hypothetical protein
VAADRNVEPGRRHVLLVCHHLTAARGTPSGDLNGVDGLMTGIDAPHDRALANVADCGNHGGVLHDRVEGGHVWQMTEGVELLGAQVEVTGRHCDVVEVGLVDLLLHGRVEQVGHGDDGEAPNGQAKRHHYQQVLAGMTSQIPPGFAGQGAHS